MPVNETSPSKPGGARSRPENDEIQPDDEADGAEHENKKKRPGGIGGVEVVENQSAKTAAHEDSKDEDGKVRRSGGGKQDALLDKHGDYEDEKCIVDVKGPAVCDDRAGARRALKA